MNSDSFLLICKDFYQRGFHPFDLNEISAELNRNIEILGESIIKERGLQEFLGYLLEGQYHVNLWAAKLGLDFGNPESNEILALSGKETIVNHCLDVFERHVRLQTTAEQKENGLNWISKTKTCYNNL